MQQRDKLGEYGKNPGEIRQWLKQGCNDNDIEKWFDSVYFQKIFSLVLEYKQNRGFGNDLV